MMADVALEVRRCGLCVFLCTSPDEMLTHFEEAHQEQLMQYTTVVIPGLHDPALPNSPVVGAQIIQQNRIDRTTDEEFTCTECEWNSTDRVMIQEHILSSEGHEDARYTQLVEQLVEISSEEDSDEEADLD